jgi:hypothetical protein
LINQIYHAGFLLVGLPVDFDLLSWPGSYAVRYGLCFKQGLVEAESIIGVIFNVIWLGGGLLWTKCIGYW